MSVEDIDFDFENSQTRIVLTREIPETSPKLSRILSSKMGQEVEVPYWTARELVQLGYARFPKKTFSIITHSRRFTGVKQFPLPGSCPHFNQISTAFSDAT